MIDDAQVQTGLAALRSRLHARAAGFWLHDGPVLRLVAFVSADDMPSEIADGFRTATREVALDRHELGVVAAYAEGRRAVSRVEQVAPDVGSGYWLHAFQAVRSVAVPISVADRIVAIVSVALAEDVRSDELIETTLRSDALKWISLS